MNIQLPFLREGFVPGTITTHWLWLRSRKWAIKVWQERGCTSNFLPQINTINTAGESLVDVHHDLQSLFLRNVLGIDVLLLKRFLGETTHMIPIDSSKYMQTYYQKLSTETNTIWLFDRNWQYVGHAADESIYDRQGRRVARYEVIHTMLCITIMAHEKAESFYVVGSGYVRHNGNPIVRVWPGDNIVTTGSNTLLGFRSGPRHWDNPLSGLVAAVAVVPQLWVDTDKYVTF